MKRFGIIAGVIALGIFGYHYTQQGHGSKSDQAEIPQAIASETLVSLKTGTLERMIVHNVPKAIPELEFKNQSGELVKLADFKGKTILVNFWATWCLPCRHEMPDIDRLALEKSGTDFEVVTINLDHGNPAKAMKFFEDIKIDNLELYTDSKNAVSRGMGVSGLPVTLLLDKNGYEISRVIGPAEWDAPEVLKMIDIVSAN